MFPNIDLPVFFSSQFQLSVRHPRSPPHVIPACPDYPGFTPPTSGPRGLAAQQPGQSPLYLWLLGSGTRASSERSGDRQQARVGRVRSLAEPLPSSWLGFSQA